jgi:hypothetical protein
MNCDSQSGENGTARFRTRHLLISSMASMSQPKTLAAFIITAVDMHRNDYGIRNPWAVWGHLAAAVSLSGWQKFCHVR